MKMKQKCRRSPHRRRGLALIEVLLCASIAAMLLTATAVTFRASVQVYRDNTDRNMLQSQGRIAMRQLISDIRQSDVQAPINDTLLPNATTLFAQGQTIENSGIQLLKEHPDGDDPSIVNGTPATYALIIWRYDAANLCITRAHTVGSTTTTTTWANYVQTFLISQSPARSATNIASGVSTYDLLNRAVCTMVMQDVNASGSIINDQGTKVVTERIIDAAVPRRNFSDIQ